MPHILFIEHNQEHAQSAQKYFTSMGHNLTIARDYTEAIDYMKNSSLDAVVSNCFLPKNNDHNDITLGQDVVKKMIAANPTEQRIRAGLELIGDYINLDDSDVKLYARTLFATTQENFLDIPVIRSVKAVSEIGKDIATSAFKEIMGNSYKNSKLSLDLYAPLLEAMIESNTNQPLGILIEEEARKMQLPYVLTIPDNNALKQPVLDYCYIRKSFPINLSSKSENGKVNDMQWRCIMSELERKKTSKISLGLSRSRCGGFAVGYRIDNNCGAQYSVDDSASYNRYFDKHLNRHYRRTRPWRYELSVDRYVPTSLKWNIPNESNQSNEYERNSLKQDLKTAEGILNTVIGHYNWLIKREQQEAREKNERK